MWHDQVFLSTGELLFTHGLWALLRIVFSPLIFALIVMFVANEIKSIRQ